MTKHRSSIGIVTEGPCEVTALPALLQQLNVNFARPVHFGGQATELPIRTLMEKKIIPTAKLLIAAKSVSRIVIVFDREARTDTAISVSRRAHSVAARLITSHPVAVIVADRMFENWLIAGGPPVGASSLIRNPFPLRYKRDSDGFDGLEALKKAMTPHTYQKIRHAPALAKLVTPTDPGVRTRSKSLRAFAVATEV